MSPQKDLISQTHININRRVNLKLMQEKSENQFSIEFFPPKTISGESKLDRVFDELSRLKPHFYSITYGANGSTKKGTQELTFRYQQKGGIIAPHISFGETSEKDIVSLLGEYKKSGVGRIVVLRGDRPNGSVDKLRYANELVEFIRKKTADQFHIDVACYPEIHPESDSIKTEVKHFKNKVDAGANSAITQYFYNPDAYFHYRDYCVQNGITIPIVPGIMPITNYDNLSRFSANCGAEIPRWLRSRLEELNGDKQGLQEYGIEVVTELCEKLLNGGAPGLHFYSMNLSASITKIWGNLSLSGKST